MTNLGREFEQAVYAFVNTLDPSAEVLFDRRIPDRDTGQPRQCDVWINAKFGGHWPLSILVSCKDRRKSGRKLHSGNIGTFCDEVRSTGASTGVIYCNTGFTRPAIRKAKANGIACCRLYQNEPPDIPEAIWHEHFACGSAVKLVLGTDVQGSGLRTWNDVFNLKIENEGENATILDIIAKVFASGESKTVSKAKETGFLPSDWRTDLDLTLRPDEVVDQLLMDVFGQWKRYRARIEAVLLDGSYCLSDGSFLGTWTGPWIDVKGSHPGEAWVEMDDEDAIPSSNMIVVISYQADARTRLREGIGPKALGRSDDR